MDKKSSGTMIVLLWALTVEEGSKIKGIMNNATRSNTNVLLILPTFSNRYIEPIKEYL